MGVSVVIPNLNSGLILDRCLDALEAATGVEEVLVLDAGSSDESDIRAGARDGVRVLELAGTTIQNRLNRGVTEASSDLSLLLNSDAFVDPEAPRLLAEPFGTNPQLAACGASLRSEDGSSQKSGDRYKTLWRMTRAALHLPPGNFAVPQGAVPRSGSTPVTWLPYCCAVVRRQAFLEVGGFDEHFGFYFEDVDFSRKLVEAKWSLEVRWEATAIHLGGGATSVNNPPAWFIRYHQNAFVYLRKWYPRAWRLYAAVWMLGAGLNSLAWSLRSLTRRARRDEEGARIATEWARAFRTASRP